MSYIMSFLYHIVGRTHGIIIIEESTAKFIYSTTSVIRLLQNYDAILLYPSYHMVGRTHRVITIEELTAKFIIYYQA